MTPGQADLARAQLALAEQALRAANVLLGEQAPEDATSRLYYAAFHACRATLTIRGVHAKTHSGLITLFEREHGEAPLLGRLFDLRGRADYGTAERPFTTSLDELGGLASDVQAFLERSRGIVEGALTQEPDEPDPVPDD